MEAKYVQYEQTGEIVKVTVNRPDQLNAISRRVYAELDEAFTRAEDDDGVKVIIVAGAGEHFGAGHDLGSAEMQSELEDFPRDMSPMGRTKDIDTGVFWRMHDRWRNIGKPTIAMVQGYCIMGSWMLVACCDLAVAVGGCEVRRPLGALGQRASRIPDAFLRARRQEGEGVSLDRRFRRCGDRASARHGQPCGAARELETATRWLAERIALNDLLSLKLSKMSVNQAADIMGQSAAVRASGNFWLLSHSSRREMDGDNSRVDWSKHQNQRFSEHEQATPAALEGGR